MPDDLFIPGMPRKQIELWDITSTSGNFRPYQIQTANIHFKCKCRKLNKLIFDLLLFFVRYEILSNLPVNDAYYLDDNLQAKISSRTWFKLNTYVLT